MICTPISRGEPANVIGPSGRTRSPTAFVTKAHALDRDVVRDRAANGSRPVPNWQDRTHPFQTVGRGAVPPAVDLTVVVSRRATGRNCPEPRPHAFDPLPCTTCLHGREGASPPRGTRSVLSSGWAADRQAQSGLACRHHQFADAKGLSVSCGHPQVRPARNHEHRPRQPVHFLRPDLPVQAHQGLDLTIDDCSQLPANKGWTAKPDGRNALEISRLWQSLKFECAYLHASKTGAQARASVIFNNHQQLHAVP